MPHPRSHRSALPVWPRSNRLLKEGSRPLSSVRPVVIHSPAAAERLEGRLLLSVVTWTGNGADGMWSNGSNWSAGIAPQAADDVQIDGAPSTTIQISLSGFQSIHSLVSSSPIRMTGGTLSVDSSAAFNGGLTVNGSEIDLNGAASASAVTLSGPAPSPTIGGSGTLTIQGLFTWLRGNLSVGETIANGGIDWHGAGLCTLAGTLTNAAGQSATLGPAGDVTVTMKNGSTFNNAGTLTAITGSIQPDVGATVRINNPGTMVVLQSDPLEQFPIGASVTFNNSGTVIVQSGELYLDGPLSQSGVISVESGAAYVDGPAAGSFTGSFVVSAGGTLQFRGNYTLAGASSIGGTGSVDFDGGTTTIGGTYDVTGSTTFSGGTANFIAKITSLGQSALTVSGGTANVGADPLELPALTMMGGSLTGSGGLTIDGVFKWSGGVIAFANTLANGGIVGGGGTVQGKLTNPAGKTFLLQGGSVFLGAGSTFFNAGTLEADGGSILADTGSGQVFSNSGSIEVDSGTLNLGAPDGGSTTGQFVVSPSGTLNFAANYTLAASSGVTGSGTVQFSGGTTSIACTYAVTGQTLFSGGTASFIAAPTDLGGAGLIVTGGRVNFGAAAILVGSATISRGTVQGTGSLTVNGLFHWSAGVLAITDTEFNSGLLIDGGVSLSGRLTIPSGQTAILTGTGTIYFDQGTLVNAGTLTALSGALNYNSGLTPSAFTNIGILNVDVPGATFSISNLDFANSGTINVQAGTLLLNAIDTGATSGTLNVSGAATMNVATGYTFNAGSTINVAGTVQFTAGTTAVNGTYNVTGASVFSGGTTTFNGRLTSLGAAGVSVLAAGPFAGNGPTVDLGNDDVSTSSLTLTGGSLLSTAVLNVSGFFSWSGGTLGARRTTASGGTVLSGANLQIADGATLINPAGQSVQMLGGTLVLGHGSTFDNEGTLTAFAGRIAGDATAVFKCAGTLDFDEPGGSFGLAAAPICDPTSAGNPGTINVRAGTLNLALPDGTSTNCAFDVSQPAVLTINGNFQFAAGSSIAGAGTVQFLGGTTVVDGQLNPTGDVTMSGDTVVLDNDVTVEGLTLLDCILSGPKSLTIRGKLTWYGGILGVAQTMADGGIDFAGANGPAVLSGGTLVNPAGQTVRMGYGGSETLSLSNGATFLNQGTFEAAAGGVGYGTGAAPMFVNVGTLADHSTGIFAIGTGHSDTNLVFRNSGTVNVEGTLSLYAPDDGNTTGTFHTSGQGLLDFEANYTLLAPLDGDAVQVWSGLLRLSSAALNQVGSLNLFNGKVDLGHGRLLIDYGSASDPAATVRGYLTAQKLFTSAADQAHALGYADSADGIVAGIATGEFLVRYTSRGDANLDGKVDFSDLLLLAQHYGSAGASWDRGDFDGNGTVDFSDLLILAQRYGDSNLTEPPAAAASLSDPLIRRKRQIA